jgi:hypothetical protein
MDRGFYSLLRIKELVQKINRYFVLRIKNNLTLEFLENGNCLVNTGCKKNEVRVANRRFRK